jgi:hypothetical protein
MTEPLKEFTGLTSAKLHAAGLTWLERAARLALDDSTMYDAQARPHDSASDTAFEVNALGDKLLQQRNIAEAALAAQIGHSLIMAGLADNPADEEPERFHGGSPEPLP